MLDFVVVKYNLSNVKNFQAIIDIYSNDYENVKEDFLFNYLDIHNIGVSLIKTKETYSILFRCTLLLTCRKQMKWVHFGKSFGRKKLNT
jgi:hypothetical protein